MKSWNRWFLFSAKAASLLAFLIFISAMLPAQDANHTSGWVVIPVEEYQTLRERAFPSEGAPELPPVEATLTRVDYDLRINGELATGRAALTVDVLKDGWVRVAIPSGLLVREAKLEGKPVSLSASEPGKSGGRLSAVLSHPGRALLLLDVALPVVSAAGEESIVLPSTSSGVTRAAIELPLAGMDVRLGGGLLAEKPQSPASGAAGKWIAYARGNEPLTFTWRKKLDDHRVEQPLRMRGSLVQLLGLGEDLTTISAEANIEVSQGAAHEVRIQLPEKVTINQVSGAMVADWEMKGGELSVTFLEPIEQTAKFTITGETHTPREGQIQIPLLRLLNAERETGGVAVEVLGAGEIKDLKSEGLENADPADLGDMVSSRQSPSLAAFRFRSGDAKSARSLTMDIARYAQQAVLLANVEEARYQVLMSNEGKTLVQARYAVRNNSRNFLKITLPPDAAIWSVTLAGKPVRPGQAPDGGLLLPLEKSRAGDEAPVFAVELIYLIRGAEWREKGEVRLALPALDVPISRTGLTVFYPLLFRVAAAPGAFRVQPYQEPFSPALNAPAAGDKEGLPIMEAGRNSGAVVATQQDKSLADYYWTKSGTRAARVLPIKLSFPTFGPSVFLVSELTAENHAETIELNYQRSKKGGAQ